MLLQQTKDVAGYGSHRVKHQTSDPRAKPIKINDLIVKGHYIVNLVMKYAENGSLPLVVRSGSSHWKLLDLKFEPNLLPFCIRELLVPLYLRLLDMQIINQINDRNALDHPSNGLKQVDQIK